MAAVSLFQTFSSLPNSHKNPSSAPNRGRANPIRNKNFLLPLHKQFPKSKETIFRSVIITKQNDISLSKTLHSYVDSGLMSEALSLFESIKNPHTYYWNVIIKGYINNGLFKEAIDFYHQMQFKGVKPDNYTYTFVIKSCVGLKELIEGLKIHGKLIKNGLDSDLFICNSFIAMYSKIGCIEFAEKVFEEMTVRDLVSWNSMIGGYVSNGEELKSFSCFREMQAVGLKPDRFGIINALLGSLNGNYLQQGKEIHCYVIRNGFELDIMIQTSLINMYSKCGNVDSAELLFDKISCRNIVVYNAMISGYALNGDSLKAIACLKKMKETEKLNPDAITMVNFLPSCAHSRNLLLGKSIHGFSIRMGFLPHLILETSLVDMYGKCGKPNLAEWVFRFISKKNLISWNAMLAAYVHNEWKKEAIHLFFDLHKKGSLRLDAFTVSIMLPAYAELASLREGKQIHSFITKLGYNLNTFVSNSIIDMYAKCGDLQTARKVFDRLFPQDLISWNTIIMAYGIHGYGEIAIELFSKMQEECIKPNYSTFVSVLSACSKSGLVDEGWKYFNSMKHDYSIDPGIEHYGCMVDLLGRAGNLDKARNFINEMPLIPTPRIWGALLAACRNNRDIELAEEIAEEIFSLEHDNTGCYILLSNMNAQAGRWKDVDRMRSLMKIKGLEKTIGYSSIELNNKLCRFTNGDQSHVESNMIYDVLSIILGQIGETMNLPYISKFKPLELMKKRSNLPITHSVRLAICYGLISTTIGSPILIRKSVRLCEDCHSAIKKISEFTEREIIVGDPTLYHHFRDGQCSCRDYW